MAQKLADAKRRGYLNAPAGHSHSVASAKGCWGIYPLFSERTPMSIGGSRRATLNFFWRYAFDSAVQQNSGNKFSLATRRRSFVVRRLTDEVGRLVTRYFIYVYYEMLCEHLSAAGW